LDSDFVGDSLFNDSYLLTNHGLGPLSNLTEFAEDSKSEPEAVAKTEKSHHHSVQTINESAGGYCIRWAGEGIPRVKIGELIGVESPSDRHSYGLGVIRWMKQLADQKLDLGLEVLSTRCKAAEIREDGNTSPRGRAPSYKCLVINDTDPSANATASLVMSAMSLRTGVDLWLSIADKEQLVRLTKLVEFSSAFARYHFEFVKTNEGDSDDADRPSNDFDDLWSNL
jgi:hypothetical protein